MGVLVLREDLDVGIFAENIQGTGDAVLNRSNGRPVHNDDLSLAFEFVDDVLGSLLTGLTIVRSHRGVDSSLRSNIDGDDDDSSLLSSPHRGRYAFAVGRAEENEVNP